MAKESYPGPPVLKYGDPVVAGTGPTFTAQHRCGV